MAGEGITTSEPSATNSSQRRQLDWARFGLSDNNANGYQQSSEVIVRPHVLEDSGFGEHDTRNNELFTEERGDTPWWKSNFFISQPVLFGTWDGVFTSVMINIFGVIIFLRSGWVVAQAGVGLSVLMVLCTVSIVLISVISAIGICERCKVESGGVYFLLSHVLGSRLAAAVGLLYCFGQAVSGALCLMGFAESIGGLLEIENPWIERAMATAVVIVLCAFNMAGVKWVIKLQFLLLLCLLLSALDFMVGSFVHADPSNGFVGWNVTTLVDNSGPDFTEGQTWFTVLGIYFPTVTGVMAGINMSGDLRNPSRDIPTGTLAAVGTCCFLYLTFILVLGSTCTRDVLYTNYLIAAKVSAIEVMLLAGLYISSLSSSLGTFYGTPRVLQSIASQKVIPVIHFLSKGRGPNRVPVYALILAAMVTLLFIWIGQLNTLAPIVTMPFLLTYACIDYAYFALAQTFNIQQEREEKYKYRARAESSDTVRLTNGNANHYGTADKVSDLDELFPERLRHRPTREMSTSSETTPVEPPTPSDMTDPLQSPAVPEQPPKPPSKKPNIGRKSQNWYSVFCNRWVSLLGLILKIVMMFLIHWAYAIANLSVVFIVWFYIGRANPGVNPGLAGDFRFFPWARDGLAAFCGRRPRGYEEIVVATEAPPLEVESSQLTEENADFASRSRYHQSSTVRGRDFDREDDELALVP